DGRLNDRSSVCLIKVFFFLKTREKLSSAQNFPYSQSSICDLLVSTTPFSFLYLFRFKDIKKSPMIITTGGLNCFGGGWLSRGFRFWWQILFDT
ncbi:hypothetical protein, partial [Leuconostoc citreum]|uniref:hypothetical protein n=1 Tax=Leuconostoc citreum TaxID=33964 RepID=UPI001D03E068